MYFYSSHLILLKIQPIRNTFCDTHFRTPFQSLTGVLQKPTMRINHCLGEQNWNTPVQLWQWLEVVWYDSEDTPGYRISDPLFIGIYITQIHMDFRWIDRAKSACTAAVDPAEGNSRGYKSGCKSETLDAYVYVRDVHVLLENRVYVCEYACVCGCTYLHI